MKVKFYSDENYHIIRLTGYSGLDTSRRDMLEVTVTTLVQFLRGNNSTFTIDQQEDYILLQLWCSEPEDEAAYEMAALTFFHLSMKYEKAFKVYMPKTELAALLDKYGGRDDKDNGPE